MCQLILLLEIFLILVAKARTKNWRPPNNTCVLLDSCIVICLSNSSHAYHAKVNEMLTNIIKQNSPYLAVPQIVLCELVSTKYGVKSYKAALKSLNDYGVSAMETTDDMIKRSGILCVLYKWLKKIEKKKFKLVDMIIGASALVYEQTHGQCVYVLTTDQKDFLEPYFKEISYYDIGKKANGEVMEAKLYRTDRLRITRDYETVKKTNFSA